MQAIFAQRLTGRLDSLDVTWRHVHRAYKGLERPVLEYGSLICDPQSILFQDELEKVQKMAVDSYQVITAMKLGV